jgi:hypothetical protein
VSRTQSHNKFPQLRKSKERELSGDQKSPTQLGINIKSPLLHPQMPRQPVLTAKLLKERTSERVKELRVERLRKAERREHPGARRSTSRGSGFSNSQKAGTAYDQFINIQINTDIMTSKN